MEALDEAMSWIGEAGCELLVVALAVDTYAGDPISAFRLASEEFPAVGRRLAGLGLPTLFLLEGGYAVAEIGVNVPGALRGFVRGESRSCSTCCRILPFLTSS